jgi:hypothetical protein
MNETFTPSDFVVPIVGVKDGDSCGPFLGTGVFVCPDAYLITCEHVLSQWKGRYGIVVERESQLFPVEVLVRSDELDLAVLNTKVYRPPHLLPLEENREITLNQMVMCFEYGTTVVAGNHIHFAPANRLGNVTRFRNIPERYGKAGDQMLELSFPALKGASGAPVMNWSPPFKLWGIVTANVGYEFMPAQIETFVDDKGELSEETKFYLPQALAIHVKHVRMLLEHKSA